MVVIFSKYSEYFLFCVFLVEKITIIIITNKQTNKWKEEIVVGLASH